LDDDIFATRHKNKLLHLLLVLAAVATAAVATQPARAWDDVRLLVQWHRSPNEQRNREYVRALRHNLDNAAITRVHLLQGADDWASRHVFEAQLWCALCEHASGTDDDECPTCEVVDDGCVAHYASRLQIDYDHGYRGRLTLKAAFQYASRHLAGRTCLVANLDIHYDESLALLRDERIDLDWRHTYFLSRYEHDEADYAIGTQCGPKYIGSHDTVVFVPPLPATLVDRCDFALGTWGIENRVMWEFYQADVAFRNPCKDIRSWHVHKTQFKGAWMPMVNDEGRSAVAYPATLFPADGYAPVHSDRARALVEWQPPHHSQPPSGSILIVRARGSRGCLDEFGDHVTVADCDFTSAYKHHQHFLWVSTVASPEAARASTLLFQKRPDQPHGVYFRIVARSSALCLTVCTSTSALSMVPCGLDGMLNEQSLSYIQTFELQPSETLSALSPAFLIVAHDSQSSRFLLRARDRAVEVVPVTDDSGNSLWSVDLVFLSASLLDTRIYI